ncbi:adenine phosphoribosyltransferase [Lutibacter agarilyticus]|uniref:Adenine phosphoribosyltransferase n=1 Tax=Lutibacter agarilyticus TaxID=1109740 RepID=A0A238WMQ5_9FLAO|nr:adenine phosphoribosyltransferase [Lutibacter agarilyticus]SNR47822.1 adenine phosphoribosyltransferase [Lutibacter agarilyticus]
MTIDAITTIEECRKVLTSEIKTFPDWPEKGVNFKDVQSILFNPELASITSHYLKELLPKNKKNEYEFNKILCFDARGFLFGFDLAKIANAPMILARKPGKLPGELITQTFQKEYGTDEIQVQEGLIKPGDKVLIHDDLLATGGTAGAAAEIILKCGAQIAGFNFIMDLTFLPGRKELQKYVPNHKIKALLEF